MEIMKELSEMKMKMEVTKGSRVSEFECLLLKGKRRLKLKRDHSCYTERLIFMLRHIKESTVHKK
jgi:adenosine deaminase